jgi:hypothetical protein
MPESPEIAAIVLLILPGLITLGLYQTLAPVKEHEITVQIVFAIIFAITSYVLVAAIHSFITWIPDPTVLLDASKGDLRMVFSLDSLLAVGAACIVSVTIAILLVVQTYNEWLHRICRHVKLTRRIGYASHWDCVAHTKGRRSWIAIRFENGSEFIGALESYSDTSEERSLLLTQVAKVTRGENREDWADNEYLFIPDISTVRSMRIHVVSKELSDEKAESSKSTVPGQIGAGIAEAADEVLAARLGREAIGPEGGEPKSR